MNTEKVCFVMMPFRDYAEYPNEHFKIVYNQIFKPAIEDAGFKPYRVDEDTICTSIIDKIFRLLQESEMALCDLSCSNPNVMYELGIRQAYDKPVVLVKDEKSDTIFDVSGISTILYKSTRVFEDVMDARGRITEALKATYENQGKYGSIVKYAKIKEANYSDVQVSHDEALQIMFEKILDEISLLKTESKNSIYDIYNSIITGKYKLHNAEDFKLFSDKIDFIINGWNNKTIELTKEEFEYMKKLLEWATKKVKDSFGSTTNKNVYANLFRKKSEQLGEIRRKREDEIKSKETENKSI